ncbi:hypothetical protein [Simiduia aestuariiviva]|uniref:Uncharacterized protein n=1 Tax=Simiduia aestuariiviva TaxID=1510459 RepID=A0A839UJ06_9GAMM|nr:hypothetical protein [Simiduia aestuariiviva]MBB3167842.1 hypothetical protein [Simiduia aestuariiviva]
MSESNSQQRYKVVFWGQVQPTVTRSEFAKRFARFFNVRNLTHLRQYFTGRLMVLKSGLTEAQAQGLATRIKQFGGVCRVECYARASLDGELALRHRPSFLQPDFDVSQLSLTPMEAPVVTAPARRNPFEAREVTQRR